MLYIVTVALKGLVVLSLIALVVLYSPVNLLYARSSEEFIAPIVFAFFLIVLIFKSSSIIRSDKRAANQFGKTISPNPDEETEVGISKDTDLVARALELQGAEETAFVETLSDAGSVGRIGSTSFGNR